MTRDKIPIDEAHASHVEEQLARLKADGPAPRQTLTRQALVKRFAVKVTSLRAAGFSLDEIADAMSYNGVKFTSEMLSSYLSRLKHGTSANHVAPEPRHKKSSKRPTPSTIPTTTRKTQPQRDTKLNSVESHDEVVDSVVPELPTTTIQIGHNPVLSESNAQAPGPRVSGGARTTKPGKSWLEKHN